MTFSQHAKRLRKALAEQAFQTEEGRQVAFIACCNFGYVQFVYNLHLSLRKIELDRHLVIACSDTESAHYLAKRKVPCLPTKTDIDLQFNGIEQEDKVAPHLKFKLRNICEAIQGETDLFVLDGDIAIFQHPRISQSSTIVAQIDDPIDSATSLYLNTGCMYLRAESATREIFNYPALAPRVVNNDQSVINEAIRNSDASVSLFAREDFPNGEYWLRYSPANPTLIHYNYITGQKNKRLQMQLSNAWFVPPAEVSIRLTGTKESMAIQLACTAILCSEIAATMHIICPQPGEAVPPLEIRGTSVFVTTEKQPTGTQEITPAQGLVAISVISEHVEGFTIHSESPFFLSTRQEASYDTGMRALGNVLRYLYSGIEPDDAIEQEDLHHVVDVYGTVVGLGDHGSKLLERAEYKCVESAT